MRASFTSPVYTSILFTLDLYFPQSVRIWNGYSFTTVALFFFFPAVIIRRSPGYSPQRTLTADMADLLPQHLQISDDALVSGIRTFIHGNGLDIHGIEICIIKPYRLPCFFCMVEFKLHAFRDVETEHIHLIAHIHEFKTHCDACHSLVWDIVIEE